MRRLRVRRLRHYLLALCALVATTSACTARGVSPHLARTRGGQLNVLVALPGDRAHRDPAEIARQHLGE